MGAADESPGRLLRDDVRMLGELLGETLRSHEGEALFDLVESVRAAAKQARLGSAEQAGALIEGLARIPAGLVLPLARAFAQFLALANVAEQHHRGRVAAGGERPVKRAIARVREAGVSAQTIVAAIASQEIELVLTAHPTQVVRRTVRLEHRAIDEALSARDDAGPAERAGLRGEIARHVAVLWHTDDVRKRKPTAVDEVRAGLILFEQVLWEAVPRHLRQLDETLRSELGESLPDGACPLRFGNWVGGDRDGNPAVTAEVTQEALLRARWTCARLWRSTLERLRDELSVVTASESFKQRAGGEREPYRAVLGALLSRVTESERWCEASVERIAAGLEAHTPPANAILDAAELVEVLDACDGSLRSVRLGVVADGRLLDARRQARCFGLTLAPLDIRQESGVHEHVLDTLTRALGLGSYRAWDEGERMAFLHRELASPRTLMPREPIHDPDARELFDVLRVVAAAGPGSLGAYVISMARAPSDVLAVILLQRELGIVPARRVVPLFETLADLERAPEVVRALLADPHYLAHAAGRVEIMVGYSDSAKDAGRLGSAWAIHRGIESLSAIAGDVQPIFFHGRGGTVGRGGAPIRDSILSLPPGTIHGRLRVTVQGESIDSTLGLGTSAVESMDLYVASVLEAVLSPPPRPRESWRQEMNTLAEQSTRAYRAIVHEAPEFVSYFRAVTPEQELGLVHAGSRPARRKPSNDVKSLRAIPWVFAWNQVRLMLPSWLGVGEALSDALADRARADRIREMVHSWPYFRSVVSLVAMSLAKGDPSVVALYERQLVGPDLGQLGDELRSGFRVAEAALVELLGQRSLLEDEPLLRESIALRNPYIDPLNILQAELLRRVRAAPAAAQEDGAQIDKELTEALLVTINGIAAGLRNTG